MFASRFSVLRVELEFCEAYKPEDECASNDEKN